MSDILKKQVDEEIRDMRRNKFWEDAWVYGAVISLLVLLSLSQFTSVN